MQTLKKRRKIAKYIDLIKKKTTKNCLITKIYIIYIFITKCSRSQRIRKKGAVIPDQVMNKIIDI